MLVKLIVLCVLVVAAQACAGPGCNGGRRRGQYDCQIDLSFPFEREDEIRERNVRREYYPRVQELQHGWWDPNSYRPYGNLSRSDSAYLHQVDSIRLARCGMSGGHPGGRWKRQALYPRGGGGGGPRGGGGGGRRGGRGGGPRGDRGGARRGGGRGQGQRVNPGGNGAWAGNIPHHNAGAPPRQEYRTLTPAQRERFHNAVRMLKQSGHYDAIAMRHRQEDAPGAHGYSAFIPWHRMYVLQFEVGLQMIDPGVIMPYIDSSLDGRLGRRFQDTSLFDWHSMGQWRGGPVMDGAFGGFRAVRGCEELGQVLTRQVTSENPLYSAGDFRRYDRFRTYQDIAGSIGFEQDHSYFHVTVGGHMNNLNCAPVDPVFFLHHAFVDYLYHRFRRNQIGNPETDYVNNATAANGFNDPMLPFENTYNRDGLRNLPIKYKESPSMRACGGNKACNGDMLWCNRGRCTATIREGSQCIAGNPSSCFCQQGRRAGCPGGMCQCH